MLQSAQRVRKALRQFLLKTHPDFFEADKDRRIDNERSLTMINSLLDGATADTKASLPSLSLPPVIQVTMHYREANKTPFSHRIIVPSHMMTTNDAEAKKQFCAEALLQMLVAAGEASPSDAGWQKKAERSEWIVLPSLDLEGLKRDMMKQSLSLDPPRLKSDPMGATTQHDWDKKVLERRLHFWLSRAIVHSSVKFFDSDECLKMLRTFAIKFPHWLNQMYDLPVMVVPPSWTQSVPQGMVLVYANDTLETMSERTATCLDEWRHAREMLRRHTMTMMELCDAVCATGDWAQIGLSAALMQSSDVCDVLVSLLEHPDALRTLQGCHVTVSKAASGRRSRVRVLPDLIVCNDVMVPQVHLFVGSNTDRLIHRLDLKYALNHAHKRASIAKAQEDLAAVCAFKLSNSFLNSSLQQQVDSLKRLYDFVKEVIPEEKEVLLRVILGAPNVSISSDGILMLPTDFTLESVSSMLKQ